MRSIAVVALAFACVLGLVSAQFGFYPPQQTSSGFGNGGFLALIGLLVIMFALFGRNSDSGDTTVIFGNFSGPTGGK